MQAVLNNYNIGAQKYYYIYDLTNVCELPRGDAWGPFDNSTDSFPSFLEA